MSTSPSHELVELGSVPQVRHPLLLCCLYHCALECSLGRLVCFNSLSDVSLADAPKLPRYTSVLFELHWGSNQILFELHWGSNQIIIIIIRILISIQYM